MRRYLAVALLLCPLAAAADWRYDGRAADSGTDMAQSEPSKSSPAVSAGPAPAEAPRGSMTMAAVRAAKGDPDREMAPVGDPPITRWQYPGYVVYFENDRVITSVAGRW
ncbi:MAG: hypothetical protein U5R46_16215 [Gammaproteobacteria bacterium]|nr:hypothetical protein [Gammaproteobacteria bacterium]